MIHASNEHIQERINFYIENNFYYLTYPNEIEEGIWKDRNGKYNFIENMDMNHLMASAKLVENDIKWYDNQKLKDIAYTPVRDALFPMAEKKLAELKREIKSRAENV